MVKWLMNETELERSDRDITEILLWYLLGGAEENQERSQDSQCSDRDSTKAPTEYKYKMLSLESLFGIYLHYPM
jgi:hypothetical protein